MKRTALSKLTVEELVERFIENCMAQDEALLENDSAKFNRLFRKMRAIVEELKLRPGDQRHALLNLYQHSNIQVRLKAAKNSLAVAPEEARQQLQQITDSQITDSQEYPQAMEAGMSLWNLERGVFKPT
jgi:flagellin-specific chaperone FliS